MEEKSRVIFYAKLRKKIENIDSYSFSDSEAIKKHLPTKKKKQNNNDEIIEDLFKPKIKKNTLSLTIDELIKEKNDYNDKKRHKEINKKFSQRVRERKGNNTNNSLIWFIIVLLILGFIGFLIFIFIREGNYR